MFAAKRRVTVILFFLITVLMLAIYYKAHADSDRKTVDGATASANTTGYYYVQNNGTYIWTAWAGFSASLSKKGRKAGYSVKGSYDLEAYMPPSGLKTQAKTFTLKIKKAVGFLWLMDDEIMGNIHRDGYSSWSSNPGGYSKSKTTCGKAKTKQCRWP